MSQALLHSGKTAENLSAVVAVGGGRTDRHHFLKERFVKVDQISLDLPKWCYIFSSGPDLML